MVKLPGRTSYLYSFPPEYIPIPDRLWLSLSKVPTTARLFADLDKLKSVTLQLVACNDHKVPASKLPLICMTYYFWMYPRRSLGKNWHSSPADV